MGNNKSINGLTLSGKDWVEFNKIVKTIELSYGVSIYKAEPLPRKTVSDSFVGRYGDEKYKPSLKALRDFLEMSYNIAIYKIEYDESNIMED